jgi:D-glycero-D-manno-heptose 1,7-bisphosphate phosphatase
MKPAVFLDRDGVLNEVIIRDGKPYPPASLAALKVPDDVLPALQRLKSAGYLLLGATNQPDVVRGKTEKSLVEAINAHLMATLPLDEMRVCYHDDADHCECRKPRPGLILQAAKAHGVDLTRSFMVGDRWRDIEAGEQAGCKTVWINRAYNETQPNSPSATVTCLKDAADWILCQG